MSFFAELKQRKVTRIAAVYLLVAWVGIQAASIALPAFDAPAWMLRVVILLFALGFPLSLALAWVLEKTPGGLRVETGKVGNRRMAWIVGGLTFLALAWFFLGQPAFRARDANTIDQRSIAVLPFVNMSGDKANDYFSDGLAETTLDMLAQVKDLKVIARTSSFAFRDKAQDVREVGKTLGAASLLEGSVQQSGEAVRITVQLIRTGDGTHLWSQHFDRRLADVFNIQDEVATAVVQALQVALSKPDEQRLVQKRTDNVAAYQEYLKGVALMPNRKVQDMRLAAQHFERAVELDAAFARAYVAAASAYARLDEYSTITEAERSRRKQYIDRALELAPELGEAHIARADSLFDAGQTDAAEGEFRRGLELSPNDATGNHWFGESLCRLGRCEEGLPLLQKAALLDPLSPVIQDAYILALGASGRIDEALAASDAQIAAHPGVALLYLARALLQEQRGDFVAALRAMQTQITLDPDAVEFRALRCHVLIDLGALPEARACVDKLNRTSPSAKTLLDARVRLAMSAGDTATALAALGEMEPPDDAYRATVLLSAGRSEEALAIFRKVRPRYFEQQPTVYPGQANEVVSVGIALVKTASMAQGQELLAAMSAALAGRLYAGGIDGRAWQEVYAHAALGDKDAAFACLQDAVNHNFFQQLPELDGDPLLGDLHADPRYAQILAPARAKASAQIDAARKAGVL